MQQTEAGASADAWYYLDAFNQAQGPFTADTIRTMAHCSDFFVCQAGFADWVLASEAKLRADGPQGRIYQLKVLPDIVEKPPVRSRRRESKEVTLDSNGQPKSTTLNAVQNVGKSLDALYGLCRGVLIDGEVSENECKCMNSWLEENPGVADMWPANVIAKRLREVLADGVVTDEERTEVRVLLEKALGGRPSVDDGVTLATRLPLTEPFPDITFGKRSFCFTGKFAFGSRAKCSDAVYERGGTVEDTVVETLDFLVIGTIASRDWAHSSHGRKIELARRRKQTSIVCEEHWVQCLSA